MTKLISRRNVLRGTMYGASISVCLPFLDCFLDGNGTALAATGAPLPVCFGTWWQGLGFNPGRWIPSTVGKGFKNNVELAVFDQFRDKMNVISGTKYNLDGRPLETHTTGWQIASMGTIPTSVNTPASLDQSIADVIGTRTRFRSIEVAIGGGRQSFSKRAGSASNPSEPSPTALYARIYGPEFKDPNAADFKPDPMVLARNSVLSAVKDERMSLMKQVGASDRARLEQYFASVRQIEHQLALDMQKPDPLPACTVPEDPKETKATADVPDAEKNAKIFGKLLAHAIACGQTRVVNVVLGSQGLHSPGSQQTWHSLTHEEPIDPKLGYQKEVTFFINWANARFADFLKELDTYKEGDHTVLDRIAILWQTDHSYARTHTMDALPIMTAGRASGRLKAGMHISLPGDPATRAGLTMQQIMGVPLKDWGTLSNQTAKTITDMVT